MSSGVDQAEALADMQDHSTLYFLQPGTGTGTFPPLNGYGYGYPEITEDDRRRIFGLNLAELLGMEPKRRVPA